MSSSDDEEREQRRERARQNADPETRGRDYVASDEAAVLAMYEEVFGRPRTAAEVARRLEQGPGGPAHRRVLERRGEVIGHRAVVPLPAWVDGQLANVVLSCDLMIRPQWQGGGRGRQIGRVRESPVGGDFGISFMSDRATVVFKRTERAHFPQWVRWHRVEHLERSAGRTFPSVTRPLVTAALGAVAGLARLPSLGVRVEVGRPADWEVDQLAMDSASFASRIHVRDAAYLRWRWPAEDVAWTVRHARSRDGALLGWVVSGQDAHRFGGTGVIGDLLAVSPRATSALVRHAADGLAAQGAGIVTCAYRDPRPWARRAMAGAGFVERGVAPPIVTHALTERGNDLLDVSGWYLTTGELL